MKRWLRNDRVYQAIMNGALWIVFIAALSSSKWPQLSWVTGWITASVVVIAGAVYWVAVISNDNCKDNATTNVNDAVQKQPLSDPERNTGLKLPRSAVRMVGQNYNSVLQADLEKLLRSISDPDFRNKALRHYLSQTKSHGRPTSYANLLIKQIEADTAERVIVKVGALRIEIEDDDGQETTNIHITANSTKADITETSDVSYGGKRHQLEPSITIH